MIVTRFRFFAFLLLVVIIYSGCDKNEETPEIDPPICTGECKVSEYITMNIKYEYVYGKGSDDNKIISANIYERANSYSNWHLWGKTELEYPSDSKVVFIYSQYFNSEWEVVSKKVLTFNNNQFLREENFDSNGPSFIAINKSEYIYDDDKLKERIYSHDDYNGIEPFKRYTFSWENGKPHTKNYFDSPVNGWDWTGHCDTIKFVNGLISEIIHYTDELNLYSKDVFVYESNKIVQIKLMLYKEEGWEEHSSGYYNYDSSGNLVSVYHDNSLSESITYIPGTGNFGRIFNYRHIWETWIPRPK